MEHAGKSSHTVEISPYIPAAVSEDEDLAIDTIKEYIAYYVGGMGTFYHQAMVRYGFKAEADLIAGAWSKGDKSGAIESVTQDMVDEISICGGSDAGGAKLAQYMDSGADMPVILFPPKASRDLVRETMEALSPVN